MYPSGAHILEEKPCGTTDLMNEVSLAASSKQHAYQIRKSKLQRLTGDSILLTEEEELSETKDPAI